MRKIARTRKPLNAQMTVTSGRERRQTSDSAMNVTTAMLAASGPSRLGVVDTSMIEPTTRTAVNSLSIVVQSLSVSPRSQRRISCSPRAAAAPSG